MILTNHQGLPEPLVAAIRADNYSFGKADISVTGLLQPPRIRQLRLKYDGVLEEDAGDMIWRLMGKVGHGILEHAAGNASGIRSKLVDVRTALARLLVLSEKSPQSEAWELLDSAYRTVDDMIPKEDGQTLIEKRFFFGTMGWLISGQVDFLPASRELTDYKFCSYHVAKEGAKDEWIQQQNIYRYIAKYGSDPTEISKLGIVAIYRDWSKLAAEREQANYPQSQVHCFNLPVWSDDEALAFIQERIKLHQDADTKLPECTDDEMWVKEPKWAVMKGQNKRATKLFDDKADAEDFVKADPRMAVERRPGARTRCEHYCSVASRCSQFQEYFRDKTGI